MSGSLRHIWLLAAVCVIALVSQSSSAQPREGYLGPETPVEPTPSGLKRGGYGTSSWEYCADEGQRCDVRGWGVVRYGARGSFVYREVNVAQVRCDNRSFSDPIPGRRKTCEVLYFQQSGGGYYPDQDYDGGWQRCAREGEICQVGSSRATVRYGVDGRFFEREVRGGSVSCDNRTFGDPAPRAKRYCEVRTGYGGPGYGGPGYDDPSYDGGDYAWGGDWVYCAREGRSCQLPGPATVRYGSNGRYTFRRVPRGGVLNCDNRTFGDPSPGDKKTCDYQIDGGFGGGGWDGHWVYCASENEFCEFRGTRNVRYAAEDGRHVVRRFRDGVECSNRAFGQDPARRERKFCSVEEGW